MSQETNNFNIQESDEFTTAAFHKRQAEEMDDDEVNPIVADSLPQLDVFRREDDQGRLRALQREMNTRAD